jgi:putative transposase
VVRRLTRGMNQLIGLVLWQSRHNFPSNTYALHYHLVMCTKYRKKCIDAAMLARFPRCRDALHRMGGSLLAFNGEADHVQLLLVLPPNLDLSQFVNNLKTTSSRLLRKEFADRLKARVSQASVLVPLVLHHHL